MQAMGVGEATGGIMGVGVGVGVGLGVGVGVGVGVPATYGSHTESIGFTDELLLTFVTDGVAKVGTVCPPCIIETVPVGDT